MVQIGPNLPKVAKLFNLIYWVKPLNYVLKTLLGGLLTKKGATLEVWKMFEPAAFYPWIWMPWFIWITWQFQNFSHFWEILPNLRNSVKKQQNLRYIFCNLWSIHWIYWNQIHKTYTKTQNIFCCVNENLMTFSYTLTGGTKKQMEKKSSLF